MCASGPGLRRPGHRGGERKGGKGRHGQSHDKTHYPPGRLVLDIKPGALGTDGTDKSYTGHVYDTTSWK